MSTTTLLAIGAYITCTVFVFGEFYNAPQRDDWE